ncbi:MAG TPA: ABC transporter permease, partial [Anaerolineae bacterium]
MRIIYIMRKDLSQIIRDRKSLLFLVLMPIIFTLFMGVALGSNPSTDTRLSVAYVTADPGGVLSQQFQSLLNTSMSIKIVSVPSDQADQVPARVRAGGFAQSSPGMLVQFSIFGLVSSAMIVTVERKARTLQRMLTTATNRTQIIAGHMAAMLVVVVLQAALLLTVGQFALGIDCLRQPLAVALVTLGLALWVACLGLFIGVVARNEEQVILYSLLAMFFFTALGGAWFSLETTGTAFSAIGHLLPSAWAMTGYQNIIVRGLGPSSVLLPCAILLGYAVVFFL